MNAEFFRALGDPVRIELIQRLASGAPHTISSLTEGLTITRQGVRKHIQVLIDSEVVTLVPKGRNTRVNLNPESLRKSKEFIAKLEKLWDTRLMALKVFVEEGEK